MVYITPNKIVSDFLRVNLTDPRARAEATNTESFTATASQTEFELTAPSGSVSCITYVEVNSTEKKKWRDFYPDFRGEKLVFFAGLSAGDSVDITYKYGTSNWIYDDKANKKLSDTSFPRIDVIVVSGSGSRLGQYEAEVESAIHFQVDIWVKEKAENQIFTIDGKKYIGESLKEYLSYLITEAFEDNESDLFPALYNYFPLQTPRSLPFNDEYQAFHGVVEFNLNGLNIGRVS